MEAKKGKVHRLQTNKFLMTHDRECWLFSRIACINWQVRTEKKLSKKVRNHQVMYTVTTIGNSTALHIERQCIIAAPLT